MQVPDAVYHLMRHTELKTCDLSSNVIKKIPAKFSVKFSLLTGKAKAKWNYIEFKLNMIKYPIPLIISELNLSNNQMHKLPDELADLAQLLRLDISHNLFLNLPSVVFKMPALRHLKANNNAIIGKDTSLHNMFFVFFLLWIFTYERMIHYRNRKWSNHRIGFLGIRWLTEKSTDTAKLR